MHHIEKVAITGFWESYNFEFKLFPEVTFLIGPNGTGKTTLINLIAAALTADFSTLDRIPFKKVVIYLKSFDNFNAPRITISKMRKGDRPFEYVEYTISPGKNAPDRKYSLEDLEEHLVLRQLSDPRWRQNRYKIMSRSLTENLRELVHVNWLSVHRTSTADRPRDERSFDSTVDQRLDELSHELVRYFSTLSRQKDDEIRSFQQSVFISLIETQKSKDLFETAPLEKLNDFRGALENIFHELHVVESKINKLLDSFFESAEHLKTLVNPQGEFSALMGEDAVVLFGLRRIEAIVDRWTALQEKLSQIFSPRDKWLRIGNDLLRRKSMELTDSNELRFVSRSKKNLTANMLSSGEKQLLILMSETLLQRERPAIFITDEPELSLHVLWQEKLVASLRALNPSAQVIIATHSPDIVGSLSKNAIDMESLIP